MLVTIIVNSAAAAEEQIKDVTNTSVVKCNVRGLLNKIRCTVRNEQLESAGTVAVQSCMGTKQTSPRQRLTDNFNRSLDGECCLNRSIKFHRDVEKVVRVGVLLLFFHTSC